MYSIAKIRISFHIYDNFWYDLRYFYLNVETKMGVPGFYRWITQRYPLVRHRLGDTSSPKIDYFYIDFNCIIYNALRSISLSKGGTLEQLFNEVCRYLDVLVQSAKPQQVIYIAVDGPAPFAKCTQQRSRRFIAARDSGSASFDTTSISVGTNFMEEMHQCLLKFLQMKVLTDKSWSTPQLIYSSHRTPGEGEHKFFNYLREIRKQSDYNVNSTHCVYSPDADLIFLALEIKEKYFYIMREYDAWIGPNEGVGNGKLNKLKVSAYDFELLHIALLKEYLCFDFPDVPINNLVDDFAGFSFLIGNDFIPHFPDIIIQHGDFDHVVEAYQQTIKSTKQFLIKDGAFNKPVLKQFLLNCVDKLGNKGNSNSKQKKKDKHPIKIDPLQSARKYIKEKYPKESKEDPELEKKLAFAVLDSFDWVLQYYTKGCPSWTWCFQYLYAPPLIIVAQYAEEHESHFEINRPPLPFEQLLCILPPKSAHLLPNCIGSLMSPPSPISSFYPTEFKTDLNGRAVEHEAVVLIPFVDVFQVRKLVDERLSKLNPEEAQRNTIIDPFIINESGTTKFDFSIKSKPKIGIPGKQDIPPSLPLFHNPLLPIEIKRTQVPVNIFTRPSDSDSLLISLDRSAFKKEVPSSASEFIEMLGKFVLADWPFLKPALVIEISDGTSSYSITSAGDIDTNQPKKTEQFDLIFQYKKERAIDISNSKLLLGVRMLQISNSAETRFTLSNSITYVPYELTIPVGMTNTLERLSTVPTPLFISQINKKVVINSGANAGKVGVIKSIKDGVATIQIIQHKIPDRFFEVLNLKNEKWLNYNKLLNNYRVDPSVLKTAFSSLPVEKEDNLNIALTLFHGKYILEGFVKTSPSGGMFVSSAAVDTITEYFEKAGSLLKVLQEYDDRHELKRISAEEIYPGKPKEAIKKAKELSDWIKTKAATANAYLITKDFITVNQTNLADAESILIGANIKPENGPIVEEPEANLIWSGKEKIDIQIAKLTARVVSIAQCGSIPFGTEGTIVGLDVNRREAFVLADEEQTYGTNMRHRLKTIRCFMQKLDDLWIAQ